MFLNFLKVFKFFLNFRFVELARKNRLNCPTPRRRSRRVVINPATLQQQQPSCEQNTSEISQTGDTSMKIKEEGSLDVAFREELSMTDVSFFE